MLGVYLFKADLFKPCLFLVLFLKQFNVLNVITENHKKKMDAQQKKANKTSDVLNRGISLLLWLLIMLT
jgi:hypothetical protein